MTIPERPPKLTCHQKDMYELQRKLVLAERELELLKERTKDCYPKEFLIWILTGNNGTFLQLARIDEVLYFTENPDINSPLKSLDDVFIYWRDKIK